LAGKKVCRNSGNTLNGPVLRMSAESEKSTAFRGWERTGMLRKTVQHAGAVSQARLLHGSGQSAYFLNAGITELHADCRSVPHENDKKS
jgi:hypothetical protein